MNEPTQLLQAEADELHQAGMEIRHLKNTIAALREELEGMRYEIQESVQRAVADAADEATQLQETAMALREELDNLNFEKDKAVQEATANSHDEIQQLMKTAAALREELDNLSFEKDKAAAVQGDEQGHGPGKQPHRHDGELPSRTGPVLEVVGPKNRGLLTPCAVGARIPANNGENSL